MKQLAVRPPNPDSLYHPCPTAVMVGIVTRDNLDPVALGTCRFCGVELP